MSCFPELDGALRSVRVLTDLKANDDTTSEDDNDSVDSEVSDIEDEIALETILQRNRAYLLNQIATWSVQTTQLASGERVQVILKPRASKMNYKLLYPSIFCKLKNLGGLDNLATLVKAPTDWKTTYDAKISKNASILSAFARYKGLAENASEPVISAHFNGLVTAMAVILETHIGAFQETPIAVNGILIENEYFLRSNTDIHFRKNGRAVIATELKTHRAFPDGAIWYRDSRGIQALSAMYGHGCTTFLASQKQWKLIVENEQRTEVLTYPFDESETFGSRSTKLLGPTFLQALCICILSKTSDSEHEDTLSPAEVAELLRTPDQKPSRNTSSVEQASKRPRMDKNEGPSSSGGGSGGQSPCGGGCSKFVMRTVAGQPAYRYVRVLAEVDVNAIENLVSSTENSRVW